MYRYQRVSGQGLRFDIFDSSHRICIAHTEEDAKLIVKALDAEKRKQDVIKAGMGRKALRDQKGAE